MWILGANPNIGHQSCNSLYTLESPLPDTGVGTSVPRLGRFSGKAGICWSTRTVLFHIIPAGNNFCSSTVNRLSLSTIFQSLRAQDTFNKGMQSVHPVPEGLPSWQALPRPIEMTTPMLSSQGYLSDGEELSP